jgi:hypothetical protein
MGEVKNNSFKKIVPRRRILVDKATVAPKIKNPAAFYTTENSVP